MSVMLLTLAYILLKAVLLGCLFILASLSNNRQWGKAKVIPSLHKDKIVGKLALFQRKFATKILNVAIKHECLLGFGGYI